MLQARIDQRITRNERGVLVVAYSTLQLKRGLRGAFTRAALSKLRGRYAYAKQVRQASVAPAR
eukprot:4034287-Prorocentrum_lima.AAC.1